MPNLFGELTQEELLRADSPLSQRLFAQSQQFGDMEFEMDTAASMGPLGAQFIDAQTVDSILSGRNTKRLLGLHINKGVSSQDLVQDMDSQLMHGRTLGDNFRDSGVDDPAELLVRNNEASPRKDIYLFEADGNTKRTAAHEFRHKAINALRTIEPSGDPVKDEALSFIKRRLPAKQDEEEVFNRQFDMYRNMDEARWSFALHEQVEELRAYAPDKDLAEIVEYSADILKKQTTHRAEQFAAMEEAAEQYLGNPPPQGTTWREFYLKQFLVRRDKMLASISDMKTRDPFTGAPKYRQIIQDYQDRMRVE